MVMYYRLIINLKTINRALRSADSCRKGGSELPAGSSAAPEIFHRKQLAGFIKQLLGRAHAAGANLVLWGGALFFLTCRSKGAGGWNARGL